MGLKSDRCRLDVFQRSKHNVRSWDSPRLQTLTTKLQMAMNFKTGLDFSFEEK